MNEPNESIKPLEPTYIDFMNWTENEWKEFLDNEFIEALSRDQNHGRNTRRVGCSDDGGCQFKKMCTMMYGECYSEFRDPTPTIGQARGTAIHDIEQNHLINKYPQFRKEQPFSIQIPQPSQPNCGEEITPTIETKIGSITVTTEMDLDINNNGPNPQETDYWHIKSDFVIDIKSSKSTIAKYDFYKALCQLNWMMGCVGAKKGLIHLISFSNTMAKIPEATKVELWEFSQSMWDASYERYKQLNEVFHEKTRSVYDLKYDEKDYCYSCSFNTVCPKFKHNFLSLMEDDRILKSEDINKRNEYAYLLKRYSVYIGKDSGRGGKYLYEVDRERVKKQFESDNNYFNSFVEQLGLINTPI